MYPLTPISFMKILISEALFCVCIPVVNKPMVCRSPGTRSTYSGDKADASVIILVSRTFARF